MAKIEDATSTLRANSGPVLVFRQGYRTNLLLNFHDGSEDRTPIDISSTTVVIEGEWYMGTVGATGITNMTKVDDKAKVVLTTKWSADSDQVANRGKSWLTVDSVMEWADNIDANADEIPILVCYLHDTHAGETRSRIFSIAWRRGNAADGVNA